MRTETYTAFGVIITKCIANVGERLTTTDVYEQDGIDFGYSLVTVGKCDIVDNEGKSLGKRSTGDFSYIKYKLNKPSAVRVIEEDSEWFIIDKKRSIAPIPHIECIKLMKNEGRVFSARDKIFIASGKLLKPSFSRELLALNSYSIAGDNTDMVAMEDTYILKFSI